MSTVTNDSTTCDNAETTGSSSSNSTNNDTKPEDIIEQSIEVKKEEEEEEIKEEIKEEIEEIINENETENKEEENEIIKKEKNDENEIENKEIEEEEKIKEIENKEEEEEEEVKMIKKERNKRDRTKSKKLIDNNNDDENIPKSTIWISDNNDNFATCNSNLSESDISNNGNEKTICENDYTLKEELHNTKKRSIIEYGVRDEDLVKFRLRHNDITPSNLFGNEKVTVYIKENKIVRELPPKSFIVLLTTTSEDVGHRNAEELVGHFGKNYDNYRMFCDDLTGERKIEIFYSTKQKALAAVENFNGIIVNEKPVTARLLK